MDQSENKDFVSNGGDLPPLQSAPEVRSAKFGALSQGKHLDADHISPQRVIITTLVAIFFAEIVAMVVIYYLTPLPYWADTLLDAGIMIAIIFPIIYSLVFRSLLIQIEDRRKMEKALIQTNELLERFFLNIHSLVAYMDRDFNFIRVNEAYARAGGHPPEFFIGKNHFDLYPNEENRAIFQRVVDTGEPFSVAEKPFEYAEFPERGVTYWDWSLQPVKSETGEVEGLVLSLVDATERVRARMQLARQNEELHQLSHAERRQREFAESLTGATIVLNASLDLDHVLHAIFEQMRKIIPFSGADIAFIEGKDLRFAGFMGFENHPKETLDKGKVLPLVDCPLIQHVCQSRQPLWIDSLEVYPEWRTILGLDWVGSYIAMPLVSKGEVIGVLNLYSEVPGVFTQEIVDRLRAFAAPAALALQNARLYEAELTARQVAETMSAAAQALSRKLDLDHVIKTLLDCVHPIAPSDICGVTLLGDNTFPSTRLVYGHGKWANLGEVPTSPIEDLTHSLLRQLFTDRRSLTFSGRVAHPLHKGWLVFDQIHNWLLVPMSEGNKIIGYVELGRANPEPYTRAQIQWAETLVDLARVAIENTRLFEQVRSSGEQLQSLTRRLVEVQENERYHIARELHDEASQSLSFLKISLGRLEQDAECPPRIRQRLRDLKGVADGLLEELHRLAMDLRPVVLDHLGLVVALEQYASKLNSEQLSVQFKAIGFKRRRLPPQVETSLYRIVQEALTNVVRHAQASNVGILLEKGWGKVRVIIEDDGIGFDPKRAIGANSMGLVGMRERAEMLGGSFTVESAPGRGTSIIVEVSDAHTHPYRR